MFVSIDWLGANKWAIEQPKTIWTAIVVGSWIGYLSVYLSIWRALQSLYCCCRRCCCWYYILSGAFKLSAQSPK